MGHKMMKTAFKKQIAIEYIDVKLEGTSQNYI